MTARKRWGALRGAAGSTRGSSPQPSERASAVDDERAGADRDRLGVRQQGQHGAVRRPALAAAQGPRQPDQRRRAASRAARSRSRPATRRTTTPAKREVVRREACSARAPTSSSRPATSTSRRRSCRSRSKAGKLTIAPCIGTDQMGPKRFGATGKLAFSFGNVAQDEGSAMAEYAWSEGLADGATSPRHTLLVYFKDVVKAFEASASRSSAARSSARRATPPGGKQRQTRRSAALNGGKADVIVTATGVRRAAGVRRPACARSATRRRS